ncbi:signal peptidase I [Candidatus Vecturithrix granuli]|uniref:Signal peptidase I n=1 Tax=Vecturithrix granuli TaxID=1499967 RepID=A0A081C6X3_VECG1|nr:signal peptidase I [Candidatus Vecturithrix granuli]
MIELKQRVHQFFFPSLTPRFLLRLVLIAVGAYLFFEQVCIPFRIHGRSMEPTYQDGGFNFCWTPSYWFAHPQLSDVVLIRFAGQQVMLLKRVVALEGETVEFQEGRLFVNGKERDEPYLKYPCDWNLPPRRVEQGKVYVVGDNRNQPSEAHQFGQTLITRIRGKPLW